MFRCSSVLVSVLAIRCILSWCSRFGLKMEPVKHVRFPHYFLLRCLLDFELARKLLQAEYTTILDSSNERLISRLPKHENKKKWRVTLCVRKLDSGGCVSHYHQADKKTLHIQSQGCDTISFVTVVFENYLRAKTLSDSIYIYLFFST